MKYYKCECGWAFIIGKKRFYGPMFTDSTNYQLSAARMQPIENLENYYGCPTNYKPKKRKKGKK